MLINVPTKIYRTKKQIFLYVDVDRSVITQLSRQARYHLVDVHGYVYDLPDDAITPFVSQSTNLRER